jgi:arylsulfatase A-like enzyme
MPDKPFFAYFAPGATHAPHHVPREWADRYKGTFDRGWDKVREETLARQKKLGVVLQDCRLTTRHPDIPAWDDMAADLKPVLARQMEMYMGYLKNTAHQVGQLVDVLEDLGILGDTLIFVIIGDNGASAEGLLQGTFNEMLTLAGFAHLETPEFLTARLDEFGGSSHITTTRWAGPMPWIRRTNGPNKSPRISAAPATAPSCTGPGGSRPKVRSAVSSIT